MITLIVLAVIYVFGYIIAVMLFRSGPAIVGDFNWQHFVLALGWPLAPLLVVIWLVAPGVFDIFTKRGQ